MSGMIVSDEILILIFQLFQVREFLAKYRCHAEHLVELVVHTNFAEVKDRLVMFWRALPGHIKDTLTQERVVNIIHLCDLAIYKSLAGSVFDLGFTFVSVYEFV